MTKSISAKVSIAKKYTITDDLLYVGIDIGKASNVADFVSNTLLARYERFENCPAIAFDAKSNVV